LTTDERGWRIALVPDALLADVLGTLEAGGYGVLQLPPSGGHAPLLAVIADQIAEYAHNGYVIVAIGDSDSLAGLHWRRLSRLLRHRRIPLPPRHLIRRVADLEQVRQSLAAFLARHTPSIEIHRPEH
jgi:hypothetical protein